MQTCARFVKRQLKKTVREYLKLTHQAQGMVSQCRTNISHANTPCAEGSALTFYWNHNQRPCKKSKCKNVHLVYGLN